VQPFLMRSWTVLVVAAACGLVLPAVPAQAAISARLPHGADLR